MRGLPGPGHYNQATVIPKNGLLFCSKYTSSMCRRFGTESREGITSKEPATRIYLFIYTIKIVTPGPGAYHLPSEFGINQFQEKNIEDTQENDVLKIRTNTNSRQGRNLRKNSHMRSSTALTRPMKPYLNK